MSKIKVQIIVCILIAILFTGASNSNNNTLTDMTDKIESELRREYSISDIETFGKGAVSTLKSIPTMAGNAAEAMAQGNQYGEPIDKKLEDGKAAVYSVAGGTVTELGNNQDIGKYIVIQHGEESVSTYGNLSDVYCSLNDRVKKGEIIGEFTENPDEPEKIFYYTLNYFD